MESFDLPGLDISVLTNPKEKTTPSNETSVTQGSQFPIKDAFVTSIPEEETEGKPVEKKAINLEKPQITVKDEEVQTSETEPAASPTKAVAEFLKSKGIVDYSDEEFRDEDDFISESVSKSITKGVEDWKEALPEELKNVISLYQDGVPIGALLEKEREIFEYSQVKPDSIKDSKDLQKTLVHNLYAEMGWTSEEITEKLQELDDSGILEKEATRALSKLTTIQQQQKQDLIAQAQNDKKARETRYKEQVEKLQTTLKGTKEFFPGVTLTEADKKAVFEGITKFNNGKNKVMEFLDKPENYMLVSYIANSLKGDFSKLTKAATTQAVTGIRETIGSTPAKSAFSGVDLGIMKKVAKL